MSDDKTEQIEQVRLPFHVNGFDFRELATFLRSVDPTWVRGLCEPRARDEPPWSDRWPPEQRD
jgi:hypothetical protein